MKLLNYKKLMAHNPELLYTITNESGQVVNFYEHPFRGDAASILATINEVAFSTGFFDLGDFYQGSDYLPVLQEDGTVVCQFEVR